jgi:hypothetical protein
MNGFEELEASWEAAVTGLDLAEALIAIGDSDRGHSLAKGSASVFERVGSVRELGRAEGLLSR